MIEERIVRCPSCGGRSLYSAANRFRPFCSGRCRNNDLGAWATEGYRVAKREDEGTDPAEPNPACS